MDAVTYPKEEVAEFITNNFVPVRVPFDHASLSKKFNIKWTPALLILDQEGKEHHRTIGFMASEELIPSLLLGMGNLKYNQNEFDKAISFYAQIFNEFPESDSVPEALYQHGVSLYKSTSDPRHLKAAYEILRESHPNSQWTKRSLPYRLIN